MERRSLELDASEPAVHALTPERAVAEWKRLEPLAIGHERPLLHEFFGRTRTCLATIDAERGEAVALCWVSSDGEIGPAVAEEAEHLVPVVLAALDRVAKQQEPETLRGLLHDRLVVAARPPAPARLPGPLAELGDVLGAAAGARPLPADAARAPALIRPRYPLPHLAHGTNGLGRSAASCSRSACCCVVAYILFKVVLGFVAAVAWIAVLVLAVIAGIWASACCAGAD